MSLLVLTVLTVIAYQDVGLLNRPLCGTKGAKKQRRSTGQSRHSTERQGRCLRQLVLCDH